MQIFFSNYYNFSFNKFSKKIFKIFLWKKKLYKKFPFSKPIPFYEKPSFRKFQKFSFLIPKQFQELFSKNF